MTKGMLFGVIGAAVVVVAALAVLTPLVIVDDDSPDVRLVAGVAPPPQIAPPGAVPQAPEGPGAIPSVPGRPFREFRDCLEQHGLGRPDRTAPPDPQQLRDALKACRGTMPGAPYGR